MFNTDNPLINMLLESLKVALSGFMPNWWALPLLLLLALLKSSWFKGYIGEVMLSKSIGKRLDPIKYHVIDDVTLQLEDGTTQIDHIVLSKYGVFVIETKNMKGWIFGGERQRMWTQKIYQHNYRFQNPLFQNKKHMRAVQELLDIDASQIHSIVVFVGDCKPKTSMPSNVILGAKKVADFVLDFSGIVFTDIEVKDMLSAVQGGRLKRGLSTSRAHNKSVRDRLRNRT